MADPFTNKLIAPSPHGWKRDWNGRLKSSGILLAGTSEDEPAVRYTYQGKLALPMGFDAVENANNENCGWNVLSQSSGLSVSFLRSVVLERSFHCEYCSASDRRRYQLDGAWLHAYDFWVFSMLLQDFFPRGFAMYLTEECAWAYITPSLPVRHNGDAFEVTLPFCPVGDYCLSAIGEQMCHIWYANHHFRLLEASPSEHERPEGDHVVHCLHAFLRNSFVVEQPCDAANAYVSGGSTRGKVDGSESCPDGLSPPTRCSPQCGTKYRPSQTSLDSLDHPILISILESCVDTPEIGAISACCRLLEAVLSRASFWENRNIDPINCRCVNLCLMRIWRARRAALPAYTTLRLHARASQCLESAHRSFPFEFDPHMGICTWLSRRPVDPAFAFMFSSQCRSDCAQIDVGLATTCCARDIALHALTCVRMGGRFGAWGASFLYDCRGEPVATKWYHNDADLPGARTLRDVTIQEQAMYTGVFERERLSLYRGRELVSYVPVGGAHEYDGCARFLYIAVTVVGRPAQRRVAVRTVAAPAAVHVVTPAPSAPFLRSVILGGSEAARL